MTWITRQTDRYQASLKTIYEIADNKKPDRFSKLNY